MTTVAIPSSQVALKVTFLLSYFLTAHHTQCQPVFYHECVLKHTSTIKKAAKRLGQSLIRSRGAKSNQRTAPAHSNRVSFICTGCHVRRWGLQNNTSFQSVLRLLCPHVYFSAVGWKESPKDEEFLPWTLLPHSPCLTLTSQYDADAIYLSPPDITTVLPAAGARGPPHH